MGTAHPTNCGLAFLVPTLCVGTSLNVSNDSFNNGLVDVADLLQAQAVFQQSEDQLTDARINCRIKQRQYLQVTGRPF